LVECDDDGRGASSESEIETRVRLEPEGGETGSADAGEEGGNWLMKKMLVPYGIKGFA
jgi:hypothetical protein